MKKTERLLSIVLALKNYGKMSAAELSSLLEVSVRTICRDIDALMQMDIPLVSITGKEGGYQVLENYFLPVISFTKDEVLALSIAKKLLDITEIPGFSPFIESAFLKIENTIDHDLRSRIDQICKRVIFDIKFISPDFEGKNYFQYIRKSFEKNKTLSMEYFSPGKLTVKTREIIPYFLDYNDGAWYLLGRPINKPAEQLWWFRLDRMKSLDLTKNDYTLPPEFNPADYSFQAKYRKMSQSKSGKKIILIVDESLYETIKHDIIFKYADLEKIDNRYKLTVFTNRDGHLTYK